MDGRISGVRFFATGCTTVVRFHPVGMGWTPGYSDRRDFTAEHPQARQALDAWPLDSSETSTSADLREFFPEVEDQGPLNASCACAVLGLVEYYQNRCSDDPPAGSRLFLYQMALRLRGTRDDLGTDLRTSLKALRRFGAPPQCHWPYEVNRFSEPPSDPFLFGFAHEYRDLVYYRPAVSSGDEKSGDVRLLALKRRLIVGVPSLLGFPLLADVTRDGIIGGFRSSAAVRGGQAMIVVGFDDALRVGSDKGAFLVRSSWGSGWGDKGYGWLSYAAFAESHRMEMWSLAARSWTSVAAES